MEIGYCDEWLLWRLCNGYGDYVCVMAMAFMAFGYMAMAMAFV